MGTSQCDRIMADRAADNGRGKLARSGAEG